MSNRLWMVNDLAAACMKDMKDMKGLTDLYVKNTRHYIDISGNTILNQKYNWINGAVRAAAQFRREMLVKFIKWVALKEGREHPLSLHHSDTPVYW